MTDGVTHETLMTTLGTVADALRRPAAVQRALARRYFAARNARGYNQAGVDIFERDWDALVILDACRADYFAQEASLPGETTVCRSRGSATKEFVTANFSNRVLGDTVYVSANLWFPKLAEDIDADVCEFVPVPEESNKAAVPPALVTRRATEVVERYPHKRLIVHYTQPHYPYLGEVGRKHFGATETPNLEAAIRAVDGEITPDIVRRAYRENLRLALDAVEPLLEDLSGKTVVTADHGEYLGERLLPLPGRQYGHPAGIYTDTLVRVPWHVHTSGPRKDIVADETETRAEVTQDVVDRRLRNLGYRV